MRERMVSLLVCCLVLFWTQGYSQAQVVLDITPNTQQAQPGSPLTFSGSLTNLDPLEVFLNGDLIDLPTGFTGDDTPFLVGAPLSLTAAGTPGDTYFGPLFTVTATGNNSPGDYIGTFLINGGGSNLDSAEIAGQTFGLSVVTPSAVPEPGSLALLSGLGVTVSLFAVRRLHRRWK